MPESSFKRTILITGSTDGIGKQTAIDLAAHPDNRVIIHGRSEEKCEATRDHIIKETGNPTNVDYIACDLSIMKEARFFLLSRCLLPLFLFCSRRFYFALESPSSQISLLKTLQQI
ncbi:unnamed protein product [Strongylus vulgaris]|uniref:Ketoreductase (KR) domain-containing protein n=1 Tax=Strongylus vulgaris TaxID=40348 RepID=A0A3P7KRD8_STRVU|nr:unnamed protein product [Strongylus vulgaris]